MALYIGGMGARDKNFYNDYVKRMGYEAAAAKIQDAFLAGRRDEASPPCPTPSSTRRRWSARPNASRIGCRPGRRAPRTTAIGTMLLGGASLEALRVVAEAVL